MMGWPNMGAQLGILQGVMLTKFGRRPWGCHIGGVAQYREPFAGFTGPHAAKLWLAALRDL